MRFLFLSISSLLAVTGNSALVDFPSSSHKERSSLNCIQNTTANCTQIHGKVSNFSSTAYSKAIDASGPVNHLADFNDPSYWLKDISHQGLAAFNSNPPGYKVFRNVKDFGARGDGSTDDTAAINAAISAGGRCAPGVCQSSTVTPAIVYFPAGTYLVSTSITPYYMTQLIGNPNELPVIKPTVSFQGLGVIDADIYVNGKQGWGSTNVFYRQIRNFVIDLTPIPPNVAATGIHWPTAQATSIQNVQITMATASNSLQQGIFIEDGSAGFISDVNITGGLYGANIGNQQFTMRNLVISNAVVGISQIWDWSWTYSGLTISNCGTAFSMSNGGSGAQNVGSVNIIDSTINNCPVFVSTAWTPNSSPPAAGSLIIENVVLNNVPVAVTGPSGTVLAGTRGSMTITTWGQGHKYTPNGPTSFQGSFTPVARPGALLGSGTNRYYTKSKPQYAASPVASFISIRSAGARGDGSTDDTTAIQNALNSAASSSKIVFFDHGTYKVSNTIYIPPSSRIVGETYAVIMASGSLWSNINGPMPVIQVGRPGDSGSVEWSDMVVSTQGSAPGAVLIEWNLNAASGSGMWDIHTRIGGFRGSNLQVGNCPTMASPIPWTCLAAYMSMHITESGTGAYLENCWFWTADHDLDDASSTRVSIYTGRGLLVEASTIWLYGTAVEHHGLYQYNIANAHFVVAGFIQTETPYMQPVPNALTQPYPISPALSDPNYTSCLSGNCDALGLRILNSQNIFIYGAGLYSFFNNYNVHCSDAPASGGVENCQSEIFAIEGVDTNNIWVYSLSTVGSQSMVTVDGASLAGWGENQAGFSDMIAYFTYRIG